MKLSLAWIFDHLDAAWHDISINDLISLFNQKVAEIEHVYPYSINLDEHFIGSCSPADTSTLVIAELSREVSLPPRKKDNDLIACAQQEVYFLVKKTDSGFTWSSLQDFGVEKDGLLTAMNCTAEDLTGNWRQQMHIKDFIIEVDNKSVTHRPDMWGHRGFAREIGAIMNIPLKPKTDFLVKHSLERFEKQSSATSTTPFVIENQAPGVCRTFNGLFFPQITNPSSNLLVASRLLSIGARPINALVDLTNYLMWDWGQPVHLYDAAKLTDKKIIIRMGHEKEKLTLLDGNTIELTNNDVVIANGIKAAGLAGIMGGLDDSISTTTTSAFLETANFDATTIRRSSMRHKTRTDASARFEKTLDPNQSTEAIMRFLGLLKQFNIAATAADEIITLGAECKPILISITHDFLISRSGLSLSHDDVISLLNRLEFEVNYLSATNSYEIQVPTFRCSKDIDIKEDIVEEVTRLYGFQNIPIILPSFVKQPSVNRSLQKLRTIKNFMAYGLQMIEQQNHAFFDERVLAEFKINPEDTIDLINPVSEFHYRLATSLIPGLLKNVQDNHVHQESLNFFEVGRTWLRKADKDDCEKKIIAGIFFRKRIPFNFYEGKKALTQLCEATGLNSAALAWEQMVEPSEPWYKPYQSARLFYHDIEIGHAGMLSASFINYLDILPESTAFIFELNQQHLVEVQQAPVRYMPFSRYQETFFDVSLLTKLSVTTADYQKALRDISPFITKITLIDFFEKEDWQNHRSLTFRFWMSHPEKAFSKEEIDDVRMRVIEIIEQVGGTLRA